MLHIALRQMSARKRQTILTLLGIVFGSAAYVIISGFMFGFREYLTDKLINNDSQIKISSQVRNIEEKDVNQALFSKGEIPLWLNPPMGRRDSSKMENPLYWLDFLKSNPNVEAFSPQFHTKAFFLRGKIMEAGKIIGVQPQSHQKVVRMQENMVLGDFRELQQSGNKIILGENLRESLGASIFDTIHIYTGGNKPIRFKLVGSFQMGNKAIDSTIGYVNLSDAQSLGNSPNQLTEISVRLKDVGLAESLAQKWKQNADVEIQSWKEINSTFISLFAVQTAMRYAMVTTILTVACFGIYNILNILITQKRKEIAILRSIGFEPSDILVIFLYQGLVLGVLGGIFGMILGYGVCIRLSKISFVNPLMQSKSGLMNISFDPIIYVYAFLLAFLATLFASIIPARAASKLAPIEVIRGE